MSTTESRRSLLLAVVANMLLISLAGTTVPALAQGKPDGARETPAAKPEAPNAYNLQGDTTNVGSSTTVFSTTLHFTATGNLFNAWEFRANDPNNAATIDASGGNIGVRADGLNFGVRATSRAGSAVSGFSDNVGFGVHGRSNRNTGVVGTSDTRDGVLGLASVANMAGVVGNNTSFNEVGYGVRGFVTSSSPASSGGYFSATNGTALFATTGGSITLKAENSRSLVDGGVAGDFEAVDVAVRGRSDFTTGVIGTTSGNGIGATVSAGLRGQALNSAGNSQASGVEGQAFGGKSSGVLGIGGLYGVRGYNLGSAASFGGFFSATVGTGLFAGSNNGRGVQGESGSNYGIFGKSNSFIGVYGFSNSFIGLYGQTSTGNFALYAVNPSKAAGKYAGFFEGNVRINGSYVATGTKSALVYTNQGERLMYAEESTMNRFSDEGTATLKDGRSVIKIDPLFAQTVSLGEGYMVLLTPDSFETSGLGVGNKSADSFEVRELNGGKGNFSFQWRLTALRKGYEKLRMAPAPAAPPLDEPADLNDMLDK